MTFNQRSKIGKTVLILRFIFSLIGWLLGLMIVIILRESDKDCYAASADLYPKYLVAN